MLLWLLVELLLDYILKIDFRSVQWMVISYVSCSSRVRAECLALLEMPGADGRFWRLAYSLSWQHWHSYSTRSHWHVGRSLDDTPPFYAESPDALPCGADA